MNALSKMAAVGHRDFVQIFGTCGFDIFYTDTESPADIAKRLGDYTLVVTTEDIFIPANPYPIVLNLDTRRIFE